jgi:hypothetical protein
MLHCTDTCKPKKTNDTTDKNQADDKETKTDVISHRLFILLQVKFFKTAN